MAEADPLRKYVEAGIAFTQLTKARAEAIVRELVKAGEVQREHTQDRVDELLDRSRKSTEGLVGTVRREIAQQLSSMGIATKDDLARLEARIEVLSAAAAPASTTSAAAPKVARAAKKAAGPSAGTAAKKAATAKRASPARPAPTVTRSEQAPPTPPPGTAARAASAPRASRRPSGTRPDARDGQG